MEKFLGQWMPVLASEHGKTIDHLIVWTHWLMLVLFAVWGLYFLYVLWRFNAKRAPRANYHGAQTHVSTYAEAGVAVVEVILLVGFSIPAWYRWTQRSPPGCVPSASRCCWSSTSATHRRWNSTRPNSTASASANSCR